MFSVVRKGIGFLFLLLLCALVSPFCVRAAELNLNESGYSALLFDSSSGLPTSEANAVVQSGNGFIWIGSYSGLIRYDGNGFVRVDSKTGIASVVSLFVDEKDRLWVGTNDSGAVFYEDGRFHFYGKKEGLPSLSVRSISEDGEGNIILATTQGLVWIDGENELHPIEDSRIKGQYVSELQRDEEGTVYGVTRDGNFFVMENLAITHFISGQETGEKISCVCPLPGKKGQVYLGTWESRVLLGNVEDDIEEYQAFSVFPQANINAVRVIDEKVWVCADNGIGYLEDGSYKVLENIPMNNSVDAIMQDYEGNLWFASSRQGVMEITSSPFTDVSGLAGLDSMVVNSTCLYQEDLYIGTDKGLAVLGKDGKRKENVLTGLLEEVRVRCIKEDSKGKLWLCTYGSMGLICYDGNGAYTIYNEENGLASNWVRAVTELEDGTVAVSASGGISLIQDGRIVRTYTEKDGIANTEILTLCDGGGGKLYLGSDGDGIYIVEGSRVRRLGLEDGLQSETILRIKKDSERELFWIITSNSISYMEEGKITTLSNFPYSNNFDLYFGGRGQIWVLSSNGIYVADREQLLTGETVQYTFYDSQCGLPYVATANSRSCVSEEGTLYISGSAGVCSIGISGERDDDKDVRLAVPFVEIDGETVYLKEGETVRIPADSRRITIYGYALTYSLRTPHVSYRLEGFDEGEILTTSNHMEPVSYTNLDSGTYVFRLSVLNELTREEEKSISITLVKEKAFYEQGWFWVLAAAAFLLLFSAAALLYTRHKTAALVKKQEENRTYIGQIIGAFAKCIDLKDKYTNGHSFRVAKYSEMLAKRLGYSGEEAERIHNIALLHDVGKITIPDEILNKPGRLTDEEFEIMKQHSINGYDILKEIEISPDLALGAGFHHERIDGKGYPTGKMGEEIPRVAQIIAVADTFDAMNSTRPYRKQMKMEDIREQLKGAAGTQLAADIVAVMLELIDEGELR